MPRGLPRGLKVGIQADDLTGACDTGAPFATRGLSTVVLFGDAPVPSPLPDVLVFDSESRELDAPQSRARARAAGERLTAAGAVIVYKKMDSTLRGAIAAELAGVLEGTRRSGVVLAPAFPAQRRTVVEGHVRVGGVPAALTSIARDPAFPATGGSVLGLLAGTGGDPAALVPLPTVRAGSAAVAARLGRFVAVFVCDAETDTDLAVLTTATEESAALLAGSAGLATALAERLAPAAVRPGPPRLRRPLLVVAGSPHPATRRQLARLEAVGAPASVLTSLPATEAMDAAERRADADRLAATTREALTTRGVPGTMLLTGGQTAASVCRALGATGLALHGEAEPGLAAGALFDGPFAGLTVVTKAGGFGDPEVILRLYQRCT